MIWWNRVFISFDNINFYEHIRDQRFHNKRYKLNYIIKYICLIYISINIQHINKDTKSLNRGVEAVFRN